MRGNLPGRSAKRRCFAGFVYADFWNRFPKALGMRLLQNTLTSYYFFFYKKSNVSKIGHQSHKLMSTL